MWTWRLEPPNPSGEGGSDATTEALSNGFAQRADAETWLGAQWRMLAAQGAHTAILLFDGDPVGAPVDLRVDG